MKARFILLSALVLFFFSGYAQNYGNVGGKSSGESVITTAVPFLMIGPDGRAGGMGDGGVATSPDANSMYWNSAKYAFIDNPSGFSISYTPWLRNLVNDINLAYLTYYHRLDDRQTIAVSLRYFSLGEMEFTVLGPGSEQEYRSLGYYKPNE